jgi:hypothetical protein
MTATLRWNRLEIAADDEAAFKKDVGANLSRLLALAHPKLELDIYRCEGLSEDAFKLIGPALADAAGSKSITVRISDELVEFFEGSGLSDLVTVCVVEPMHGTVRQIIEEEDDEEAIPLDTEIKEDTVPPNGGARASALASGSTTARLVDVEDESAYAFSDEILIGREPPSDPVYPIPTISKRHFRIYRQGPGFFIEDLRSTNGTYLNGAALSQPQPLADGDEIVVAITLKHPKGARRFKFTIER